MAKWEHRAVKHKRIGKYLFQVNIPKDRNIHEFEVVAFDNGTIKDRGIFWDSAESHEDGINLMWEHLNPRYEFDPELGHDIIV